MLKTAKKACAEVKADLASRLSLLFLLWGDTISSQVKIHLFVQRIDFKCVLKYCTKIFVLELQLLAGNNSILLPRVGAMDNVFSFLCSMSGQSNSCLFWRMVQALTGTTRIPLCSVKCHVQNASIVQPCGNLFPFLPLDVHWDSNMT